MGQHIKIAVKMVLITTILLGIIYPLVVTCLGQLLFHKQANGSLITQGNRVLGSELIGQSFTAPGLFHSRPSAAGQSGYDPTASGGSNLSPTSKVLVARVRADVDSVVAENPGLQKGNVPVDMVTASASGLDPDITPANAYAQAARVARIRGLSEPEVRDAIKKHTTSRQFGILGEPRVNVLKLNLALQNMKTK